MNFFYTRIVLFISMIIVSGGGVFCQNNAVIDLKCEYLNNPIGIDAKFPRFSWRLEDTGYNVGQTAYQIEIISNNKEVWNSGKVSSEKSLVVYDGKPLAPFSNYEWKVTCWGKNNNVYKSGTSFFETGMVEQASWKGYWISDDSDKNVKFAPYFRKIFFVTEKVKKARAYIAVAGLYELYINGKRVGNQYLDPAFTRFDRRTLYATHDVTEYIAEGENVIGVVLGNGWYNHQSFAVWNFDKAPWRNRPTFCFDLHLNYDSGESKVVSSDLSWKTSEGAITFNSIYTAEHHDNRLEQKGWNNKSFNDSGWNKVIARSAPSDKIIAQTLHPIRTNEKIFPIKFKKISDTCYVYDLGRNISGISELKVEGLKGTVIKLIHGEKIDSNGHVDLSNLTRHYRPVDDSDPFQTDIFILSGKGTETFKPFFNYKGFQYIEVVSSKPIKLGMDNLFSYFMYSDVPAVGKISTSNDLLNRIWEATNNSYLSNLFGYPTDCPQREKNGWTGDGHFAIETGLYNFDGITIYEKWMDDHRDAQQPNGKLPNIIPTGGWGYQWPATFVDWTSSIAVIPWYLYLFYGDVQPLYENYENIKRFVEHVNYNFPSGLTNWGYGDWVPIKSISNVELLTSIYYYNAVLILSKIAKLKGAKIDFDRYSELSGKIKDAINKKYLKPDGIYASGYQTELSMPLFWNIVPDSMRSKVAANLAKKVITDGQMDVGVLGAKSLLNSLHENGYPELAYNLATNDNFPSWGWWIKNGATTLLEDWDINSKSGAASLNHIMFGEIGAWIFKGLGGIYPDEKNPGFKNIILKPNFVEKLESFNCSFHSRFGKIVSNWKIDNQYIIYKVTIPPNSTADLDLKNAVEKLIINDKTRSLQSIKRIGYSRYKLESGNYTFFLKK